MKLSELNGPLCAKRPTHVAKAYFPHMLLKFVLCKMHLFVCSSAILEVNCASIMQKAIYFVIEVPSYKVNGHINSTPEIHTYIHTVSEQ